MPPRKRDWLACPILAPPAGFEPAHTAPERNSHTAATSRNAACAACTERVGTRGIVILSFAVCRHRAHDREGHAYLTCLDPVDDAGYLVDEADITFWGLCPQCRPEAG